MKTICKKVVILFLLTLSVCPVSAQTDIDTAVVMDRCRQEVAMLNAYIKIMAEKTATDKSQQDKDKEKEFKQDMKESALSLFIYNGKDYTEIIERWNGERKAIHREGVQMEISRLYWTKVRGRSFQREDRYKKPMGVYFDDVINFRYKSVEIRTTDIKDMQVGEIYQLDDGHYVCNVYFEQKFIGKMGDGRNYQEITHKYVVCDILVIQNPKSGRNEYFVRLGDVHVEKTENV